MLLCCDEPTIAYADVLSSCVEQPEIKAERIKPPRKPANRTISVLPPQTIPATFDDVQELVYYNPNHYGEFPNRLRHVYESEHNLSNAQRAKYRARIKHYTAYGDHETVDIRGRYDTATDAAKQVVRFFKWQHGALWSQYANLKALSDEAIESFDDTAGEGLQPIWMARVYINGRLKILENPLSRVGGFATEEKAERYAREWVKSQFPMVWMLALSRRRVW